MSRFEKHALKVIALCAAVLLIAGIIMVITQASDSGSFTTRTGAISGGTITGAGVIALVAVLGGMLLALFRGGRKKGENKKK